MSKIVLGSDVPDLLVILQSGFTNKFAIGLQVEPEELVGITAKLKIGATTYDSVLDGTKYVWTLTAAEVATMNSLTSAVLSLQTSDGETKLASGKIEVRL